mgnify:CR=1 FL=1
MTSLPSPISRITKFSPPTVTYLSEFFTVTAALLIITISLTLSRITRFSVTVTRGTRKSRSYSISANKFTVFRTYFPPVFFFLFSLCTARLIYCIFLSKILAKAVQKVYNTFVIGSRAAFGLIISCKSGGELEYGTSYRKRKRKFGIRSEKIQKILR